MNAQAQAIAGVRQVERSALSRAAQACRRRVWTLLAFLGVARKTSPLPPLPKLAVAEAAERSNASLGSLLRALQQDGEVAKGPEIFSVYARLKIVQWYAQNEKHWVAEALSEKLADALERAYLQGLGADPNYLGNLTTLAVERYAIECCKKSPAWDLLSVSDDSDNPTTSSFKQEMAQLLWDQLAEQRLENSLRAWDMNNPR